MMQPADSAVAELFRNFSPELVAEKLRRIYQNGQPGTLFCNFYYTDAILVLQHLQRGEPARDVPWMLFGRDVFGKQSLCYRITGNTIEVKRIPGQISAGWREIPQGVVVVIRHEEIARNGISFNDEIKKLHLQFTFKDLWTADCSVFYLVRNEAVTFFTDRLENSIEHVQTYKVPGCDDLFRINTQILPIEEVKELQDEYVGQFIDLFRKIMIRRYLPPPHGNIPLMFLFSGGVDSLFVTMTAAMTADESQEFVLVNVSFSEDGNDFEIAPDRERGVTAYTFLKEKFPERIFHFLRVNVTKDELQLERTSSIAKAIAPGYSVLDDSIGCVMWFACRARGIEDGVEVSYDKAIHVLVGSGSDEILGGYSRHRGRFEREGYDGLFEELRLEIENIGNRNLGRDDRVALSNNRLIIAPFLDEEVVRFVNALPIQIKVDFSKPRGFGEKMILRNALKQLGCPEVLYTAPKKAMQFGTRIAKLEKTGEKGSDICDRLKIPNEESAQATIVASD